MANIPAMNSPFQLLVEGDNDLHTICQLLLRQGIDLSKHFEHAVYVRSCGGIDPLLDHELPIRLKDPTAYPRVGIIMDADEDISGRRLSLFDRIQKEIQDIAIPNEFPRDGFITELEVRGKPLRLGVWVMPDNEHSGKLEDFLARMIPGSDPCWGYCEDVVDTASAKGAPFAAKDRSKAKMHTWLAWREKPGNPFGVAIKAGDLESEGALALRLVNWCSLLFGPRKTS